MIRGMLQRFMAGRYGPDQLNSALMGVYLILLLLGVLTGLALLETIAFVLAVLTLFRMLSRNHAARRAENARFLKMVQPLIRWFRLQRTIHKDKAHRYFKCPNCGQYLRVPKGKGRITVNCRGCGAKFEEKS